MTRMWQCSACAHSLHYVPEDPFGPCEACGVASPLHQVFSPPSNAERESTIREIERLASLWATARVLKYRKYPSELAATQRAEHAHKALMDYLNQNI